VGIFEYCMCDVNENPPSEVALLLETLEKRFEVSFNENRRRNAKMVRLERAFELCCGRGSLEALRRFVEKYVLFFGDFFVYDFRPNFRRALIAACRSGSEEKVRLLFVSERLGYNFVPTPKMLEVLYPSDHRLNRFSLVEKMYVLVLSLPVAYASRSYSVLKTVCDEMESMFLALQQHELQLSPEELEKYLKVQNDSVSIRASAEMDTEELATHAYLSFIMTFSLLRGTDPRMILLLLTVRPGILRRAIVLHERHMKTTCKKKMMILTSDVKPMSAAIEVTVSTTTELLIASDLKSLKLSNDLLLQLLRVNFERKIARPFRKAQESSKKVSATHSTSNTTSSLPIATSIIESARKLHSILNAAFPELQLKSL
jgi:hypothetical protein